MKLRKALSISAAAALLVALSTNVPAQLAGDPTAAELDDPAFRAIVNTGPRNSDELRKLVTTYAANGMHDAAASAFAGYLLRRDAPTDVFCDYCQELFSAGHKTDQSPLVDPLLAATDMVLDEAFATGSSDALVRLAVMTASSSVREHRDRSLYFLTAAAQLGIDDAWRDEVVQALTMVGHTRDALKVARSIYEDPSSAHYHSDSIGQWINYLSREIDRNEQIGSIIAAAATR